MTTQKALFAGGCFWGMEQLFRELPGVTNTEVGYTGGESNDPTYTQVCTGKTGHTESLLIEFDPQKISYADLLTFFFKVHDPTTKNQQGNDIGSQYRSAIFYFTEEQKTAAQNRIEKVNAAKVWPSPIVTEITAAQTFYPAEADHQDYLQKYPTGYTCHYIRPLKF